MPREKPNVMIVMTDQQRADFLADQGFGVDTMPYLESLKERGVWFRSAYTTMPICMPARVSMLTGRYSKAHGMIANWDPVKPRYERDLIQVFGDAGYELALFGKNHAHVTEKQFDVWRPYWHTQGVPRPGQMRQDAAFDRWMVELNHWIAPEPTPFSLDHQYPVRIVSDAIAWLRQRREPFLAWVSFPEPHSPYQVPAPYFDLFPPEEVPERVAGPEALKQKNYQWQFQYQTIKHYHPECDELWRRYRSNYCGMLRLIDDQLRRLVSALEEHDLLGNTLVLFLSDHGDFAGDYGLYRKGLALPECLIRIPMLWFGGPVEPREGDHPAHVSIADIFPTLCEMLGTELPDGVQGRSLWPLLRGKSYSEREFSSVYVEQGIGGVALSEEDEVEFGSPADTVYIDGEARTNFDGTQVATSGFRRALIKDKWKLVYDISLPVEVYDLEKDPAELNNLAQHEEIESIKNELVEELLYWSVRLDDNLGVKRYSVKVPPHNWYR